jgi:hypothetical protein
MQYLEDILEITYVGPICNAFNMGVNQYLIVASQNTKVKKYSLIAIPLFGLLYSYWGYTIPSWVY